MPTFFKIFVFFLLKLVISGKDGTQLTGSDTITFESILPIGGKLCLEADPTTTEEAINLVLNFEPTNICRNFHWMASN